MNIWSQFGRLLAAERPQERVLSGLIVFLAIAYAGLSLQEQSSACVGRPVVQGLQAVWSPQCTH